MPPTRPSKLILPTASTMCCSRRRSRSSAGSKKPRRLRHEFWNYNLHSGTAGNFFSGVDCAPTLAASLSEALRAAGLPE
jgi:hypothetical protein